MKENELLKLWQRGNDLLENGHLHREQIEKFLKPRVTRLTLHISILFFMYVLAQVASLFLLSYNLYGYRGNAAMQAVSSVLILACVSFLFLDGRWFRSFKRIGRQSSDIFSLLRDKTVFFTREFEWWNLVSAATLWILSFALNTVVDNANGVYRINKPFFFAAVSIVMMAFIYVVNKVSTGMTLKETKYCLKELEGALQGDEESLAQIRKRHKRFTIIAVAILTVLFIIGLLMFLGRS
jgi:hypothetical protein